MKKVKFKFLLFIIIFLNYTNYTQITIDGKVVDQNCSIGLSDVIIKNIYKDSTVLSKSDGKFCVLVDGVYEFSKKGYFKKTVQIRKDVFNIIQLEIKSTELNEINVNTSQKPQKLKNIPSSISIISQNEIKRNYDISLVPSLNKISGIYMHSGALNTNRITIRGIGARNPYGTSKIRCFYEDIPITNGDGESNIDVFELSSISNIEIIKGPNSSVYGSGLGGAIRLNPKKGLLNEKKIETSLLIGSFGLIKEVVNANIGYNKNSLNISFSNTERKGYRDNNEYNRKSIIINSTHFLNEKNVFTFLGNFLSLKAFIPSSLNEEKYLNNPSSADYNWEQSKGHEDNKMGIFGFNWKHYFNNKFILKNSLFGSFRMGYEPRPFNILSENNIVTGIRSRLEKEFEIFNEKSNFTFGFEIFNENHNFQKYENLYQNFSSINGSVQGNIISDFDEKRLVSNIFFESNINLFSNFKIIVALNHNRTNYILEDVQNFMTSNDQSGSYSFNNILSPKFGLSYLMSEKVNVFGNISHGFSTPKLEETLLPNGIINQDIQPELGWNFEIGSRGLLIKEKLQYNLSFYRMNISNLLVSRRTDFDEYIGINAGKTTHEGIEFELNYILIKSNHLSFEINKSLTINNHIFKEFIDLDNNYAGNKLTGLPNNIINSGFILKNKNIYCSFNLQHVGEIPVTDNNLIFTEKFTILNSKIGLNVILKESFEINTFFGINNFTNQSYASQILINASSFGGNQPRYYYPGEPINHYLGIKLNYIFKN